MVELKALVKKIFIVQAVISCFTCYARPDYNLPLFAFAYLLWDTQKPASQKTRLIYLFVFSWIIDFVWIVYWGPFWDSSLFDNNWAKGVQTFVLVLSVINFLIKLVSIVISIFSEPECKDAFSIEGFIRNAKSAISAE